MIPQLIVVTECISSFDLPIERLPYLLSGILSSYHILWLGFGMGLLVSLGAMWVLASRTYLLRRLMKFSGGQGPGVRRNE